MTTRPATTFVPVNFNTPAEGKLRILMLERPEPSGSAYFEAKSDAAHVRIESSFKSLENAVSAGASFTPPITTVTVVGNDSEKLSDARTVKVFAPFSFSAGV